MAAGRSLINLKNSFLIDAERLRASLFLSEFVLNKKSENFTFAPYAVLHPPPRGAMAAVGAA
jgi:hypothetical protein